MVDRTRPGNKRKLVWRERLEVLQRAILMAGVVTAVLTAVPVAVNAGDVASAEASGELGFGVVQEGTGETGTVAPRDENVDRGLWSEAWAVFALAYSFIALYAYWMRWAFSSHAT